MSNVKPIAGLVCVLAIGVAAGCVAVTGGGVEPVRIQLNAPQLFVDDYLIETQSSLERTLHQPTKEEGGRSPAIRAVEGTTLLAYGSIVFDERLQGYVMFVQEFPSRTMYRFTSADGLNWSPKGDGEFEVTRFDLDLEREEGARGTTGIDLFSCYYDRNDDDYPYKGWLYFANYGPHREGIYYVQSRDGRSWERGRQVVNAWSGQGDDSSQTVHQDGKTVYGPGDVTLFSFDPLEDCFLGLFKFFTSEAVGPGNHLRSRAYAYVNRLDEPVDTSRIRRIALLPAVDYAGGDTPYDEYYASTAWRYGPLWLGGLKVWHDGGDYPHSAAGCAFLKLVVSRDGLYWKKVPYLNDSGVPEVFLPNGPEGGNDGQNDGGYISEFSQGPLRIGDELVYYYSASSFGKNWEPDVRIRGGGIFRARLRSDGFVSVDAGTLVTRPLAFDGSDLFVNAVGPVTVEVLTPDGKAAGSMSFSGDSLSHHWSYEGQSLRALMPGGVCRLRFVVEPGGRLYSFTVR